MKASIAGWVSTGCEVMADVGDVVSELGDGLVAIEVHGLIEKHGIEALLNALADGAESAADVQDATDEGAHMRRQLMALVNVLRVVP